MTMTVELNMFPALVVGPTGSLNGRAFISDGRLRVYTEGGGRSIQVAVNELVVGTADIEGRAQAFNVTTEDGSVYQVMIGGGCGCGSPLKTYDPALHGVEPPA